MGVGVMVGVGVAVGSGVFVAVALGLGMAVPELLVVGTAVSALPSSGVGEGPACSGVAEGRVSSVATSSELAGGGPPKAPLDGVWVRVSFVVPVLVS